MKRIITFILLAGIGSSALAQEPIEVAKAFYATKEWTNAFIGYYGVNSAVEPGLPKDEDELEALTAIRDLLQFGRASDVQAAAGIVSALIQEQRKDNTQTSPMILQIAGALSMKLAGMANNDTERMAHSKRAETYLKQAIEPNTGFPNFLRAHKNLANLLLLSDRPQEAKVHFVKAVELGDRDAVTFGHLGAIYMDEGKLISSETALRNSLTFNPSIIEFKHLLGKVLMQQERYQEASAVFTELLQKMPNEINFWIAQAKCQTAMENVDEAAQILEILHFMGDANVDSLLLLGDVYIKKEMIDEATERYLEAVSAKNANSRHFEQFIESVETLNNLEEYEKSMRIVEAINRNFAGDLSSEQAVDMLFLQAEINVSLGQGTDAVDKLEELLKRDPFNARALLSLAQYYAELDPNPSLDQPGQDMEKSRNEERAIIYFERAQELDDQMAQVRAYIGEAQLRVKRDELDLAADRLEDAQGIHYSESIQPFLDQVRQALKN